MKQIYSIVRVEYNACYLSTDVINSYESFEDAKDDFLEIILEDFNYLKDDLEEEGKTLYEFVNENFIDEKNWSYDNYSTIVVYSIHSSEMVLK